MNYKPEECTTANLPTPETNTKRCFPVVLVGGGHGRRRRGLVPQVRRRRGRRGRPVTGTGAQDKLTTYDYPGAPAWHYDDNELVKPKKKTWSQWRGYGRAQVDGRGGQQAVRTESTFLRGMDGDRRARAAARTTVTVTASDARRSPTTTGHQGFVREQPQFNGATTRSPAR